MLLEERMPRGGSYAADPSFAPQASLGDVLKTSFDAMRYAHNADANIAAYEQAYDRRIDAIYAATGQKRDNPFRVGSGFLARNEGFAKAKGGGLVDPHEDFQRWLNDLAKQKPDLRDIIRPDRPVLSDAIDIQRRALDASDDAYARAPSGILTGAAYFGGMFAGSLDDPVNLAALALGPWRAVGWGAKALLWNGVKTGAINAAAEVVSYPAVKEWRQKAGLEYTPQQLAEHSGMAFAFGFGLDAGIRGGYRGARVLRGDEPIVNAKGGVVGYVPRKAGAAGEEILDTKGNVRGYRLGAPDLTAGGRSPAPLAPADPSAALEAAARSLPKSNPVRRAAEGDRAALDELVAAAGLENDPGIRGAKLADDADATLRAEFDEADKALSLAKRLREDDEASFAQALRSATDDAEPPPGRVDPVQEARGPDLSDEAPLPKGRKNQHGLTFQVDGKKVRAREIDPRKLTTDPETFQVKTGRNPLQNVTVWEPSAAGRMVVFEKKSGEMVAADGHARTELAGRIEGDIRQPAYVLREADGWTPADARTLAAKKNLQEGSVGTLDTARLLRESPDILDTSMPLGTEAMRQARALARLSDDAFGQVETGNVPATHAALVGELVPDQSKHAALIADLVRAEPRNAAEARVMLGELMGEPNPQYQRTILGAREQIDTGGLRANGFDEPNGEMAKAQVEALETELRDAAARPATGAQPAYAGPPLEPAEIDAVAAAWRDLREALAGSGREPTRTPEEAQKLLDYIRQRTGKDVIEFPTHEPMSFRDVWANDDLSLLEKVGNLDLLIKRWVLPDWSNVRVQDVPVSRLDYAQKAVVNKIVGDYVSGARDRKGPVLLKHNPKTNRFLVLDGTHRATSERVLGQKVVRDAHVIYDRPWHHRLFGIRDEAVRDLTQALTKELEDYGIDPNAFGDEGDLRRFLGGEAAQEPGRNPRAEGAQAGAADEITPFTQELAASKREGAIAVIVKGCNL